MIEIRLAAVAASLVFTTTYVAAQQTIRIGLILRLVLR